MSTVSYIPNLSGLAYQKYQLRSSALSLRSLRSAKSLKSLNSTVNCSPEHWWQRRPILLDGWYTTLQKASYHVSILIIIETSLQILISMFNIYCLLFLAQPGAKHFRRLGLSFIFVYTGNQSVRWTLILSSSILMICSIILLATTIILVKALKKENEIRFIYFIKAIAVFGIMRFLVTIFELIVNDLYYLYHQFNFLIWTLFTVINLFAYLVVLSNYQELNDFAKLQDMFKEKTLNVSRSIQDTSHLSTISNKLMTSNDIFRNQSILSTPTQSICGGGSTVSQSFDQIDYGHKKQLMLQQQQLQQLKLDQAYNKLKQAQPPLQCPTIENL